MLICRHVKNVHGTVAAGALLGVNSRVAARALYR
jgi:hypothetical protein